ncbi:(2Fe-2S)-binding protein [Kribbella sp. NBC_00709]|uniref:(2Fe-2S)-binding protein n=1 Tax=Kribbella sp. NBC_00709 TaxID=2975972 RepID=UPI002E2C6438|nr:(2Fe-2S)-binding protein [Kribbella sp. NBC_00709]
MTELTSKVAVLERVAALGPFFAFEEHATDPAPELPWHSMSELVDDPSVLQDRVTQTQAYLAAAGDQSPEDIEVRVAASITHLGLVARLISPALALATLDAGIPSVTLEQVRWQPVLGGAFPLSLPDSPYSLQAAAPQQLADRLSADLFRGPIPALAKATEPFAVSAHILRGNTASAINGAATALANAAPHLAERAAHLASLLLSTPPLRDTHTTFPDTGRFRRRSCCLIYRAAPDHNGPLCGDCALTHA